MKSAYQPAPILAPPNPAAVKSDTGLGTKGGAGLWKSNSGGEWDILLRADTDATQGGNVVIQFASPPPALFVSTIDAFGTLSQSLVGNQLTVSWTGRPYAGNHTLRIEWASS